MRITTVSAIDTSAVWTAASRTLTNPSGVWSDATRILTAFAAENLFVYPLSDSTYPGINIITSATVNTFGAWVQVSADVGVGRVLKDGGIAFSSPANDWLWAELEYGEGAAGVEAAVARVLIPALVTTAGSSTSAFPFMLSRVLTDNARLSARIRCGFGAATTFRLVSNLVA